MVHRDVKPQNILLDKAGHVFVSAFGLAKSLGSDAVALTRTGVNLGTAQAVSPEQVMGTAVDHRSDIYALGLILYEMATGESAFPGETAMRIMYRRLNEKPRHPREINSDLPRYLGRIILRCLEKDPAKRYQTAHEVLIDLEAGLNHVVQAKKLVLFLLIGVVLLTIIGVSHYVGRPRIHLSLQGGPCATRWSRPALLALPQFGRARLQELGACFPIFPPVGKKVRLQYRVPKSTPVQYPKIATPSAPPVTPPLLDMPKHAPMDLVLPSLLSQNKTFEFPVEHRHHLSTSRGVLLLSRNEVMFDVSAPERNKGHALRVSRLDIAALTQSREELTLRLNDGRSFRFRIAGSQIQNIKAALKELNYDATKKNPSRN